MSDLLNIGASGIRAYRNALSTVGENVANAETPGYTRREVRLRESAIVAANDPYHTLASRNGGVEVASVERIWDNFRAADARLSSADAARASSRAEWMQSAEAGLNDGDAGIGAKLTTFFNAATVLAAEPDGVLPRRQMLNALGDAATQIRTSAAALTRVSDGIAAEAGATTDGINDDLAAIANVNLALNRSAPGSVAAANLSDERDRLLDGLSAKIGVDASFDAKGMATVTLAGSTGKTLVEAGNVNLLKIERAKNGQLALSLTGDSVTAVAPTGGAMAGLIDAAGIVAGSRDTLDGIARDFAAQVNGWNANGVTPPPAGAAGPPLLAGVDAATLALADGIDGIAIAARGADGSANGNLLALGGLRGANGAEARVEALIGANAQLLASTRAEASAAGTRRDLAFEARDAVSGVDLDKEAADLMRFQQAYDGSARVLQVARETIQTILQLF